MTPHINDRVRLAARPDVTGVVISTGVAGRVLVSGVGFRYAEELELDSPGDRGAVKRGGDIGPFDLRLHSFTHAVLDPRPYTCYLIEAPSTDGEAARCV